MKATRQLIRLCLGIGMIIGGYVIVSAQDIAKADPSSSYKTFHTKVKALTIGDRVPDLLFENVLNYKSKTAKLSDFKGKLVILDLWSTSCTSCIAAFPKMEQLQKSFQGQIQILLVNPHVSKFDSEERVKTVLSKLKTRTGYYPSLPIPIHDSILNDYFPHEAVPHQIWIDSNRRVVAVAGFNDATFEKIQAYLEGKGLNIPVKDDWAFNPKNPLLIDNNGGRDNDYIFRSLFTGFKGGIGFGTGRRLNENREVVGYYMLNMPLSQIVNAAYYDITARINRNRRILEVHDPAKYGWGLNESNMYCYDLSMPPIQQNKFDVKKYLQEDLKRVFNIRVYKEVRKMTCLVLTASKKITSYQTKYEKPDMDLEKNSIKKYIRNYPVAEIIKYLDNFDIPLIDETGLSKNMDIDFPDNFDLSDQKAVLQILRQTGFDLKEVERELEVIVITD